LWPPHLGTPLMQWPRCRRGLFHAKDILRVVNACARRHVFKH
jgi:hypothetical protein